MSKSNKSASECKVCCGVAYNNYYGVKSCEPCKVFFKRNAENRTKILKCDFNGRCEVNMSNRHMCAACRLKKCLEVGMSAQMIRAPRIKKTNQNINSLRNLQPKNNQIAKFSTLNLLDGDKSLLSRNEWDHLSNLIHCYDEHNALPIAKDLMDQLESLHPKLRLKFDLDKILNLIIIFYQTSEPFIQANQDFMSLPSDTRSILLRDSIDNVSCLAGGFLLRQSELIQNLVIQQGLEKIFGTIPFNLTLKAISLLDQDINLVKLTLALFAFSTTNSTVFDQENKLIYIIDTQPILNIQHFYVELIWKYLIYKYSFEQAVSKFNNLIQCLITALSVRTHLQSVQSHTNAIDSIIQKIQQKQMDIDQN